jgi:quinoprotein glucose dehydrogenase
MSMRGTWLSPWIALAVAAAPAAARAEDWPSYAGDKASAKYSALAQIDAASFSQLKPAWTWRSPENDLVKASPALKTWVWEATPLAVDGVLYTSTSLSQVAAIHAATGKTLWTYDPGTWKAGTPPNQGFVHRGVAYWAGSGEPRILFGTGDGYLIALDARTGNPVAGFGKNGRIDLTEGLGRPVDRKLYAVTSPPVICRGVVVVGSSILDFPFQSGMPRGDLRGFDVRTGKLLWTFHSVPTEGEFGVETWDKESWKTAGAANVWTAMSADESLGYIYAPFSTPDNDYFGAGRPGAGLFGESLVALDARTGKRIWHFQMVHHGLWDYDLPAAPNLVDLQVDGKPIKAVAQVSKQGYCYVFDRVTGKPLWPIEERPVAKSDVPGEASWPTQPVPTRPPAFERQGFTEADVIDVTPELRKEALAILARYHHGPLFTPPSLDKPTLVLPGVAGGASWAGAAFDPATGTLYVPSVTLPFAVTLTHPPVPHTAYFGAFSVPDLVRGVPLWKPPYARITAIDLTTGEQRWMTPVGDLDRSNPALAGVDRAPLGRPARVHVLATKTLLIAAQEGTTQRARAASGGYAMIAEFEVRDPKLLAFDKATGKLVAELALPRNATGAPMTYAVRGKQYLVVATGGSNLPAELLAYRLP